MRLSVNEKSCEQKRNRPYDGRIDRRRRGNRRTDTDSNVPQPKLRFGGIIRYYDANSVICKSTTASKKMTQDEHDVSIVTACNSLVP